MKKILIIPVMLICLTGASSRRFEPATYGVRQELKSVPINTKVDSLGLKLKDLDSLIREL